MQGRRRWALIAAGVALFGLGATGYVFARPNSSAPRVARDLGARRAALGLWRGFSARVSPRLLILTGQGRIEFPSSGFPDRADEAAFLTGRYRLQASLPTGQVSSDGYQLSSARDTYRSIRRPIPGHRARPHGRLVIRAVRFGRARFATDRGQQRLPAWFFFFEGVRDPAKVLAVRSSSVFSAPRPRKLQVDASPYPDRATIAPDDRTITLSFTGAAAGSAPCDASYTIASTADRDAVALPILDHSSPALADQVCTLEGYDRSATVRLTQPLGARALISSNYAAIISLPEQSPKRLSVANLTSDPRRRVRAELGSYCLPDGAGTQACRDAVSDSLTPGRLAVSSGDFLDFRIDAPASSLTAQFADVSRAGKVSQVTGPLRALRSGYDWTLKMPRRVDSADILNVFVRFGFGDASFEIGTTPRVTPRKAPSGH